MKSPLTVLLAGLFILVIGIALGAGGVLLWLASNPDQGPRRESPPLVMATDAGQNGANLNVPVANLQADPSGITWSIPPRCENHPLDLVGWKLALAESNAVQTGGLVERASLLSPARPAEQAFEAAGQLQQALALNVASGRLNRATEIALPRFPEIHTVGDLLAHMENAAGKMGIQQAAGDDGLLEAVETVLTGEAIIRPVCANLIAVQDGSRVERLTWSVDGVQPQPSAFATGLTTANPLQANLDSGVASPDGAWAVYTSLGWDEGGSIFLQNLQTGVWTNLIAEINARRTPDQPELNESDWWAVIDWFPDSRRLLVGRADASAVLVVYLEGFTYQTYSFAGEGNGGPTVIDLAPDGSRIVYLGFDAEGGQTLNTLEFASGAAVTVLRQPPGSGALYYPRFSPDGSRVAYLLQTGDPMSGLTHAIYILSLADGASTQLVEGNVGLTVPAWSPDGQYIAYTRPDSGRAVVLTEGEAPPVEYVNLWVAPVAGGAPQQMTFAQGSVRSPQWAADSRTLAFITQDGRVGLANLDNPGSAWPAETTSPAFPLLTGAFFVP